MGSSFSTLRYHDSMKDARLEIPEPAIDGPWRVNTHGARIVLARNGSGFEELTLIDHSSIAIYGPFSSPYLRTMASKVAHWATKQPESLLTASYDGGSILGSRTDGEQLDNFLQSLIFYGESILSLMKKSGLTVSTNAKYFAPVIVLSGDELKRPGVQDSLEKLASLAGATALRPVFVLEDPSLLRKGIRDSLSWQAFMGREQIRFSRELYPLELKAGMATRVPMAIAIDSVNGAARVLNSLGYEPTAASKERKQAIADERADYERFLEGLTDGK